MSHTLEISSKSDKDSSNRFVKVPKILYSANRSQAARNASKKFYALDSRTGLPVTPHKRGFFRVSKSPSGYEVYSIEYRVGTKLFSVQKDRVIIESRWGNNREMIPEDILNSALFLIERHHLRGSIEDTIRGKSNAKDARPDWSGDYPKKNIHTATNRKK